MDSLGNQPTNYHPGNSYKCCSYLSCTVVMPRSPCKVHLMVFSSLWHFFQDVATRVSTTVMACQALEACHINVMIVCVVKASLDELLAARRVQPSHESMSK